MQLQSVLLRPCGVIVGLPVACVGPIVAHWVQTHVPSTTPLSRPPPAASRAIARLIEGKSAEEIRAAFRLPDDLTEEEKLEPIAAPLGSESPEFLCGTDACCLGMFDMFSWSRPRRR